METRWRVCGAEGRRPNDWSSDVQHTTPAHHPFRPRSQWFFDAQHGSDWDTFVANALVYLLVFVTTLVNLFLLDAWKAWRRERKRYGGTKALAEILAPENPFDDRDIEIDSDDEIWGYEMEQIFPIYMAC